VAGADSRRSRPSDHLEYFPNALNAVNGGAQPQVERAIRPRMMGRIGRARLNALPFRASLIAKSEQTQGGTTCSHG
jgi:hypothetical protein